MHRAGPDLPIVDIKAGLTSCEIIITPEKMVRAVLVFDGVEVGFTADESPPDQKQAATERALSTHRPL